MCMPKCAHYLCNIFRSRIYYTPLVLHGRAVFCAWVCTFAGLEAGVLINLVRLKGGQRSYTHRGPNIPHSSDIEMICKYWSFNVIYLHTQHTWTLTPIPHTHSTNSEHTAAVLCVTCSMNKSFIISGADDSSIVVARLDTGKLVRTNALNSEIARFRYASMRQCEARS